MTFFGKKKGLQVHCCAFDSVFLMNVFKGGLVISLTWFATRVKTQSLCYSRLPNRPDDYKFYSLTMTDFFIRLYGTDCWDKILNRHFHLHRIHSVSSKIFTLVPADTFCHFQHYFSFCKLWSYLNFLTDKSALWSILKI